jgi:lysophospholipase L1-like esterase
MFGIEGSEMRIAFFGDSLTAGVPGSSYFAILREQYPDHTLLNFGKGSDTVISLYNRISKLQIDGPFDLAFSWIGVNDVPQIDTWVSRAFHRLLGQPRSRDMDEFRIHFQASFNLLCDNARRVTTVSPMLRGEDLENHWNRRLADMGNLIKDITSNYPQVEFLDLRSVFVKEMEERESPVYDPKNPFRVLQDLVTLRSEERIDRKVAKRGFHLTLDGVHLNSAGARLVAEAFAEYIEKRREE